MHRKWNFNWRRLPLLLVICVITLSQQGCFVHRKHFSLGSMWFDYNTLRAPAIFFQKQEHMPYKADQVSYFHWQYGVTPGKDVRYSRPDLWGGNQPYQVPINSVMEVGATEEIVESETLSKPTVISNGSMDVAPEIKSKKKLKLFDMKFIPPAPGASPTSNAPLRPLAPPIPAPSK